MCGIAGIIYKKQGQDGRADIEKMARLVSHRGPDGEGFWHADPVYFGHRRLSILDLSNAGAQPMEYSGYVIIYNGEIYNYLEIKKELEQHGYSFRSHCDTEVIVAAYKCWGKDCLHRFNGMWAFAIYDPHRNQVFCSRDRFGIKPFYYIDRSDKFAFGSEIRQLLFLIQRPKARLQAISHYLLFNQVDYSSETFFEGIKSLAAGHYLIYNLAGLQFSIYQYYEIHIQPEYEQLDYPEAKSQFQQQFQRSIEWRLRSDVKIGTCLSGGLDSSFIALEASKRYHFKNTRFAAFTASSIDENWDETGYAGQVSDALNLDWHVTKPGVEQFIKSVDNVCRAQEEPFVSPSIFMQFETMRLAHTAGLKVLLDGQGADETLMGYDRYIIAHGRQLKGFSRLQYLNKASKQYQVALHDLFKIQYYFSNYHLRKRLAPLRFQGINPNVVDAVDDVFLQELTLAYHNPVALQKLEIQRSHLPALLRYEDKNSMHFSIETRLPYLDWQLLEFNLSIPAAYKMKDGWSKFLLRDCMKDELPDSISWRRKKFAFNAPEKIWLGERSHFLELIDGSGMLKKLFKTLPDINNIDTGLLWKMINLACWERAFDVEF